MDLSFTPAQRAWREAARALALRELLLQEARRLGIVPDPEVDETGRGETDDEAVIRALLDRQVKPDRAGEEECRRYYENNVDRFRTPDLFEASHILVEPQDDGAAAWAEAEAEARAIAAEVGDDPEAFAAAARELSGCPSAHQGGSLGQIRRGELVEALQDAIETLPEKSTRREPVRSRFGWHVVRLQRRIEGRTLPFDVVRDRVADMLEAGLVDDGPGQRCEGRVHHSARASRADACAPSSSPRAAMSHAQSR